MNCNRNGRCVNEHTNFTCNCNPGFTGELCSMDMQSNGTYSHYIVYVFVSNPDIDTIETEEAFGSVVLSVTYIYRSGWSCH